MVTTAASIADLAVLLPSWKGAVIWSAFLVNLPEGPAVRFSCYYCAVVGITKTCDIK